MRLPPDIEERVVPKFDWIRLLERLPAKSPLYTHDGCSPQCKRLDKARGSTSWLRASTIAHIGVTLALRAEVDGTGAWPGIDVLAAKTKRHRSTVIAALGHLEHKELLFAELRGGSMGIPRSWATRYVLIRPPDKVMADAGLGDELGRIYDWFTRQEVG